MLNRINQVKKDNTEFHYILDSALRIFDEGQLKRCVKHFDSLLPSSLFRTGHKSKRQDHLRIRWAK